MLSFCRAQRLWVGALLLMLIAASARSIPAWAANAPRPEAQEQSGPQPAPGEPKTEPKTSQAPQDDTDTDIDNQVIRDVLEPLQRGLQDFDLQGVMGIFDRDGMPGYGQLREQLSAFFERYESVIMRYQLLQVTTETDGAYAVIDIDMDAAPADETLLRQRRSVQMRFHLKMTPKGWKVVGFTPTDFFAE